MKNEYQRAVSKIESALLRRRTGLARIRLRPLGAAAGDDAKQIDALCSGTALRPLHDYYAIAPDVAKSRLAAVLAKDLAHEAPVLDDETAAGCAEQFVALFGKNARFYTNEEPQDDSAWVPMTDSSFDRAIIGIDESVVALIWVRDED